MLQNMYNDLDFLLFSWEGEARTAHFWSWYLAPGHGRTQCFYSKQIWLGFSVELSARMTRTHFHICIHEKSTYDFGGLAAQEKRVPACMAAGPTVVSVFFCPCCQCILELSLRTYSGLALAWEFSVEHLLGQVSSQLQFADLRKIWG